MPNENIVIIAKGMKNKTCSLCGSERHYKTFCPANRKRISPRGKQSARWYIYKVAWMKRHEGEDKYCWICDKYLPDNEVTLDHVIPRSRAPELRYVDSNIRPCCWNCNGAKGSKVLDA